MSVNHSQVQGGRRGGGGWRCSGFKAYEDLHFVFSRLELAMFCVALIKTDSFCT